MKLNQNLWFKQYNNQINRRKKKEKKKYSNRPKFRTWKWQKTKNRKINAAIEI